MLGSLFKQFQVVRYTSDYREKNWLPIFWVSKSLFDKCGEIELVEIIYSAGHAAIAVVRTMKNIVVRAIKNDFEVYRFATS